MFVTPSLDFASLELWWIVALPELTDEQLLVQYWHSLFLSLHMDSFAARLLQLIVPYVLSTLFEIVQILRIDLQHDDDKISKFTS